MDSGHTKTLSPWLLADSLFLGSLLPLRRPAVEKVHLMFLKRTKPFFFVIVGRVTGLS